MRPGGADETGWRVAAAAVFAAAVVVVSARETTQAASPERPPAAAPAPQSAAARDTATFAGGCFWCMVHPFDTLPGVLSVTSGYTGGSLTHPTYQQVSAGGTGHAESVQIVYDPTRIGYATLLDVFWHNVDPLSSTGQFCDVGEQYRSEIFVHDSAQRSVAEASKAALDRSGRFRSPIVTAIVPAGPFYPAEEYHQDYYRKNPLRYRFYRWACGRDKRLKALWGTDARVGASH